MNTPKTKRIRGHDLDTQERTHPETDRLQAGSKRAPGSWPRRRRNPFLLIYPTRTSAHTPNEHCNGRYETRQSFPHGSDFQPCTGPLPGAPSSITVCMLQHWGKGQLPEKVSLYWDQRQTHLFTRSSVSNNENAVYFQFTFSQGGPVTVWQPGVGGLSGHCWRSLILMVSPVSIFL